MEIKKDKFGKLSSDPIFEDGKVTFPSFTNSEIAREGETWEAELIKEIPLGKTDRKGQPMFKGIFRLIEFKQMKRTNCGGDEWHDPFGRGGKLVTNLRARSITYLGDEDEKCTEIIYYEVVSNHPQIYTTTQFEDAINLEINKVMSENEALTSFELENYYELKTAVAPNGKAVEYVLVKIKLN